MCFLLRDANRCESVQNGLALYFQFACQIVDSNFAHPSLFYFPIALAAHIGLFEVGIVVQLLSLNSLDPRPGKCFVPRLATVVSVVDAFV